MMGVEIEVKVPASRIWRIAILKKVGEAVLYPYSYCVIPQPNQWGLRA
jgi:hypothetical protein